MKTPDPALPAIERGILTVGVGKKSSQNLSGELAGEILAALRKGGVNPLSKGAFLGALLTKGVSPEESVLAKAFPKGTFDDPRQLINILSPRAPIAAKELCIKLVKREYLSMSLAEELGGVLFSKKTGDELRGLAVSILRVRYETPEEYAGLLSAMRQTLSKEFSGSSKKGEAIIQFSEPFDGVERSFLITPLLARHVQERGYRAVSLVGRSPGPKSGLNLKDLYHALKGSFARHGSNLKKEKPAFGWALDQADFSKSLDQWVEKRWKTKKRPFLSTLEKIINPSGAEILVTSAFHPPYTEKMVACAEGAGFSAVIVFRRGIEGTLTLSPAREAEAICSVVDEKGEWHRTPFEFSYNSPSGARLSADKNIVAPTPAGNADWIYQYADKGMTKETQFDRQAVFSTAVLDKCLDWVEAGLEKKK